MSSKINIYGVTFHYKFLTQKPKLVMRAFIFRKYFWLHLSNGTSETIIVGKLNETIKAT